jgi:signal transduction histidine kinase
MRTSGARTLSWPVGATPPASAAPAGDALARPPHPGARGQTVRPSRPSCAARTASPAPEPENLASPLSGHDGLDLVVEMAHDLRSPLTSILFLADALQHGQSGPVTAAQRRALGLMHSAALSLCTAASDVLELARGGNRLVDQDPQPFSLSDVLTSVRDMLLPLAEAKEVEIRLVHPEPPCRIGYPRALSRVLLNLASNAVKVTDSGFIELAACDAGGTMLELSVRDTGPGLDTASMRTLYQPFPRIGADPRHHFSSAGLGLAICRKLVAAMDSDLKVETALRRGTRFSFVVDLPEAPTPAASEPAPAVPAPPAPAA